MHQLALFVGVPGDGGSYRVTQGLSNVVTRTGYGTWSPGGPVSAPTTGGTFALTITSHSP